MNELNHDHHDDDLRDARDVRDRGDADRRADDGGPVAEPAVSEATIDALANATVVDAEGHKVGEVGQVYLSDTDGTPTWVTVKTGLFGSRETLVPIHGQRVTGDEIQVPFSTDVIKDAPNIDAGHHISEQEEAELHSYYGMHGWSARPAAAGEQAAAPAQTARTTEQAEPVAEPAQPVRTAEHEQSGVGAGEVAAAAGAAGVASGAVTEPHHEHQQDHQHEHQHGLEHHDHPHEAGHHGDTLGDEGSASGPADAGGLGAARSADAAPGGRRISELDEVVDGGYSVGSAAPIHDNAQPMGHPVRGWEDTKSFRAGPETDGEREPDVWFSSDEAARNAGFHHADEY